MQFALAFKSLFGLKNTQAGHINEFFNAIFVNFSQSIFMSFRSSKIVVYLEIR